MATFTRKARVLGLKIAFLRAHMHSQMCSIVFSAGNASVDVTIFSFLLPLILNFISSLLAQYQQHWHSRFLVFSFLSPSVIEWWMLIRLICLIGFSLPSRENGTTENRSSQDVENWGENCSLHYMLGSIFSIPWIISLSLFEIHVNGTSSGHISIERYNFFGGCSSHKV